MIKITNKTEVHPLPEFPFATILKNGNVCIYFQVDYPKVHSVNLNQGAESVTHSNIYSALKYIKHNDEKIVNLELILTDIKEENKDE